MELKHKNCGGVISIDIANMFSLKTHSIILTPEQVKLGVLDLVVRGSRQGSPSFLCAKCDEKFKIEHLEDVVAMCLVCTKSKPVDDLYTSYAIPCICGECKKEVTGKGEGKSPLAECFDVSLSDMKFTSLVDILKKPIN